MARIEGEITIHRPVEEVFDFVADERNEPQYNPRMLDVQLISDAPIGLGARFRAELRTGRGTMPMTIEFTGFSRPIRLASVTHSPMMDTTGALTFEPAGDGTRMRWSWDVEPRGLLRLMPGVVGVIGRRQERTIWGNLKRLLESGVARRSDRVRTMTAADARRAVDKGRDLSDPTSDATRRPNVLVAYASEHGSAEGIARRIAARLDTTAHVDLRPVEEADDLEPYAAVILGSGVYSQSWIPSATEFVRRNDEALAARTVWLFSVGSFGDTHHVIGKLMRREPNEIRQIQHAIHPREYRIFAGVIDRHQWPLASRVFFHAFGGRFGDNRDWPEIDAWADTIAQTLSQSDSRKPDTGTQPRQLERRSFRRPLNCFVARHGR